WVRNGNDVLVLAAEQQLVPYRVWRLALPSAEARQIVHDSNSYWCLSATADGRVIASLQADQRTTIWRALVADLNDYTNIPSGKTDGRLGLRWTPDNKILFDSSANGAREIWAMEADGTNRNRLTSGAAADERAESSSDGRFIIYVSRQQANDVPHIWLLDRNGGNRKQLTNGSGEYEAHFSPDGRWIIYVSKNANGKAAVWKMPTGGGPAVQITAEQIEELSPAISPDGQLLAYYKGLGLQSKRIEVLTWGGLRLQQSFEVRRTAYQLRWTSDGRALTYADTENEVTNLWKQSLSGGKPKQITFFKTDKVGRFDWSRDGKYLICSRHAWQRDVFLIKDFKQP
ncbi:MAG TPA: hypothetical protein VFZ34_34125, partial [Blastocatellia bacterium]|nr:hypothetical protein [Blastocatellia bacterium]